MEQIQKQPEVKKMDFTITRTDELFWFNIKKEGQEDHVIELNRYDALELAEIFDIVIRTDQGKEEGYDQDND